MGLPNTAFDIYKKAVNKGKEFIAFLLLISYSKRAGERCFLIYSLSRENCKQRHQVTKKHSGAASCLCSLLRCGLTVFIPIKDDGPLLRS